LSQSSVVAVIGGGVAIMAVVMKSSATGKVESRLVTAMFRHEREVTPSRHPEKPPALTVGR